MYKPDEVKQEFLKPVPILYIYKGKMEQSLITNDENTATQITLKTAVNEVATLSFVIPFTPERKIDILTSLEKLVSFQGIYFIIKEIEVEDGSSRDIKVNCVEVADSLKGIYCECVTAIGMLPEQIFNEIVKASKVDIGYKWLGTDIGNVYRHVVTDKEASVYENLMSLAKIYNATIEFSYDESGQGYIYLRKNTVNNGKFIKKNIDLKTLTITSTTKQIYTKIYPLGKTDDYGITLDIQAVNNGNSILTDYSYYQAMGIPDNIIIKEPQYNQLLQISDDTYIDANDLLTWAKEELNKNSKPQWTAEVALSDLSVYIEDPTEVPKIMTGLRVIDEDIEFIFDCQITSVERNFDNPMDVKLEISNVIPYSTDTQKTGHAIETIDSITTNDPRDVDGNIKGDGSNTIIASKVCDGDHINVVYRLNQSFSEIKEQGDLISLRVEEQNKSFAELQIKADSITSHVEDISDTSHKVYSEIQQTARNIKAIVVEDSDSGSVELNKDKFVVAFNGSTNRMAVIDRTEGLYLGNPDAGTYSKVGYDGRLTLLYKGAKHPYHCLTYTHMYEHLIGNGKDYQPHNFSLPSMFDGIPVEDISITAGVAKAYDSDDGDESVQYWTGVIPEITADRDIILNVMSTWRDYTYESGETGHWVSEFSEARAGYLNVQVVITA